MPASGDDPEGGSRARSSLHRHATSIVSEPGGTGRSPTATCIVNTNRRYV